MKKKNLLSIFVLVLTTATAIVFWLTWRNSFETPENLSIYISGGLILILLITLLDIAFLLESERFVISSLMISMLPILYIGQDFIVYTLFSFTTGVIFLFLTYKSFLKDREMYKKFSIWHSLKSRNVLFVLIFSLSLLSVGKSSLSKESFRIKIPDQVFDLASKISSNLISGGGDGQDGLSGSMASQTFDREIPRLKSELTRMGITDEKAVNEQINAARKAYLEQVENIVGGNRESVNSALESQMKAVRDSLDRQLNDVLSPYLIYRPYFVGLSFFLTLYFFSALIAGLSNLLFFLVFKLLLHTGFMTIKTRTEEVEFLEI